MSENKFLEKFQNKTSSDLEYILENTEKYNPQAVAASIEILEKRKSNLDGSPINDDISDPKEQVLNSESADTLTKNTKKKYLTTDPNAPELHSKNVIIVFSGLFSTIFGAVLLMYNMKQTKNPNGRIQVLIFGILYTMATVFILNQLNTRSNIAFMINLLGGIVLNEYFWNKFIGKEFQYRKRSWIRPAIISVIISIPFVLAVIYGE